MGRHGRTFLPPLSIPPPQGKVAAAGLPKAASAPPSLPSVCRRASVFCARRTLMMIVSCPTLKAHSIFCGIRFHPQDAGKEGIGYYNIACLCPATPSSETNLPGQLLPRSLSLDGREHWQLAFVSVNLALFTKRQVEPKCHKRHIHPS